MRLTLEKILTLKNIPLFAGLSEDTLADIIDEGIETPAMIGTDIVKEGEQWNDLYIVLQGQLRACKNGETVAEYNALSTFGELAALEAETAGATVSALEDSALIKIGGAALYRLMNEHASLEKNMFQTLCRRLRKAERK